MSRVSSQLYNLPLFSQAGPDGSWRPQYGALCRQSSRATARNENIKNDLIMTLRHHGALLSNTLLISNTSVAANVSGKLCPLAQSPLIPLIGMVAHCWHQLSVSFCERLFMVWTNNWDKWQLRTQSWWYTLTLPQHTQPRKDQIRSVSWLIFYI